MRSYPIQEDFHPAIIMHYILSLVTLYALLEISAHHNLDLPFDSPELVATRFHELVLAFAVIYNHDGDLTIVHVSGGR